MTDVRTVTLSVDDHATALAVLVEQRDGALEDARDTSTDMAADRATFQARADALTRVVEAFIADPRSSYADLSGDAALTVVIDPAKVDPLLAASVAVVPGSPARVEVEWIGPGTDAPEDSGKVYVRASGGEPVAIPTTAVLVGYRETSPERRGAHALPPRERGDAEGPPLATLANMRYAASLPYAAEVVAWEPESGETCSANPNDYFQLRPLDELKLDGRPMFLMRRTPASMAPAWRV